ncbi:GNAT family N-acetyltransferase [Streptococcus pluranimalium]
MIQGISLELIQEVDKEQFILDNQEAFNFGALEEFGQRNTDFEEEGQIISRATIEKAIDEGTAYRICYQGRKVGGLIVKVKGAHGDLDILFISPHEHSKGLGFAAWDAVEKRYPQVKIWETVTPYFEQRNIHFYVNRCGFHIVEFYNKYNPDPNDTESGLSDDHFSEGMFRFKKIMK